MRLTKKLEAEVLALYKDYWDAYLKGDLKTFASYLDENIVVYGTAVGEIFTNKKDAVKFYTETADQMTGKADFRNRTFKLKANRETIVIFEQSDLYVLMDGVWTFYDSARITGILEKKGNSWKLVHQHGSFPDSRTDEGDQISTDKIKAENLRLKKAIKRRTLELENKNRELEIETALEKVRTIAMGMRKPDDMLDVCKAISIQLQLLGVKEIRNVQTAIFYEQRGTYMNYEFYMKHDKTFITETVFTDNKIHNEFATKMMMGRGEVFITHIKGSEVKDWIAYQKTTNVFIDKYLETASSLNYYWFSLGPVALGISTYHPLTEDEINLFKKFLKVFELAYQRYLDIEKAQAQAREAQIEASLERVRAVAMSMNKSDDLLSICDVCFKEFNKLGFENLRNVVIHIPNEEKKYFMDYDYSDFLGGSINNIHYDSHPVIENYLKQIKKADDAFAEVIVEGKELDSWRDFRRSSGQLDDPRLDGISALYYYLYSIGIGDIGISTLKSIDESQIKILKRFRNVFDLAYRRYTDITLAEAQAREAEIQLALERLRARSLAMHNTSELQEVVNIVAQQLHKMNLDINGGVFISINDEVDKDIPLWASGGAADYVQKVTVPFLNKPILVLLRNAIKRKNNFFTEEHSYEEKIELFEHLFKYPPWNSHSQQRKRELLSREGGYTRSVAISHYTSISITNHNGKKFSDDNNEILKRFGNVFEQSYIRFLDLQKAEAQAREAQIEASLERVRSRTMGMQKSDELKEVIQLVYEQLVQLNIQTEHTGFIMDYKTRDDYNSWIADRFGTPSQIIIPYFDCIYYNRFNDAKEKGLDFFALTLSFEEKNKFYDGLFKLIPGFPEESKKIIFDAPAFAISTVLLENVALYIENFAGVPYSEEENNTLIRFGKVFQQTYTRFLDLIKVETQNKIIQADNDRKTKELEEARQLQLSMLPKELPQIPNLDIAVYMKTATEVGGDYYDFNIDDNGTLTVLVGDATGHGMMSGMMVSIMKSFFISNRRSIDLKQFFENANNSLKEMHLGRLMMPMIGVQINSEKLIATNAGMPSLLYFRNKSQKAGEFVSNNLPLGGMKGTQYLLKEIRYEKGDVLLLMSDGFAELKNEHNEQYGYTRVKEQFRAISHKSANEIIEELKNTASQWLNGLEPDDDVTFVVIKIK